MKIFEKLKDFVYWECYNRLKGNNQDVVCAVIINEDKILAQTAQKNNLINTDDTQYVVPGGKVELGETLLSYNNMETKGNDRSNAKISDADIMEILQEKGDIRLDGELDRETFDLKRNEIQVKLNRVKNKIATHEKADSSFDETILGLLDIATQAGYIWIIW